MKEFKYLCQKENPEITEYEGFSENFQNSVTYISNVRLVYGHSFELPDEYVINLIGSKAILEYSVDDDGKRKYGVTEFEKNTFLESLSNLNIGMWKKHCYSCSISDTEEHYELASESSIFILDGSSWNLDISYSNGDKRIAFSACNFYPSNYEELEQLFRKLKSEKAISKPTCEEQLYEILGELNL